MAFEGGEGAPGRRPGPASGGDAPRSLDGVALPAALFATDPALGGAVFVVEPVEVSFFTPRPAAEVARLCAEIAGVAPARRVMVDRYFDTPDHALFRQGVAARLREYRVNPRPVRFEVLVVSWRGSADARPAGPRANRVLVQTFERNDGARLDEMRARYAAAGLVEVARVEKTRTGFDVLPMRAEGGGAGVLAGVDGRPVEGLAALRITDLGIKVLVDELHDSPFPEATIVEVEYDAAHRERAAALAARVRAALGPGARPKERNKIAYLLAGAVPPADRKGERG